VASQDDVVVRLRLADVARFVADVKAGKLAVDDLEKKIRSVSRTAEAGSKEYGGLGLWGATVGRMKYAVAGLALTVAAGAGALATFAVKSTASLEQVRIGFKQLLGSHGAADQMIGNLQEFAKRTPFNFQDVTTLTQKLLAFGDPANQVLGTLTSIGNAVSAFGGSSADMDGIVTAMGQIAMKGHIAGQEVLQLNNHMINAKKYLMDALGVDGNKLAKLMEAGKISSGTAIPIILAGMQKEFGGMMDVQSRSLSGIWSNLFDTVQQELTRRVSPFLPAMESWLQQLVDKVPQIADIISGIISSAVGLAQKGISIGGGIVSAFQSGDGHAIGQGIQETVTGGLVALGGWLRGIDWFTQGQNVGKQAVPFLIGLMSGLFDLDTLKDTFEKHTVDMILGLAGVIGIGKLAGPIEKILTKIPFLKLFAPLFGKIDTLAGPLGRRVFSMFSSVGSAIGRAFYKVFPEASANIWYFFARIGELMNPRNLLKFFGKAGGFAVDLIERMFTFGFGIVKKVLDGPFGRAILDIIAGVREMGSDIWKALFQPMVEVAKMALKGVFNWFASHWNGIIGHVPGLGSWSQIPLLAAGGTAVSAGAAVVGDRGPELINMPRGASVVPLPRVPEFSGVAGGGQDSRPVYLVADGRVIAEIVEHGNDDRAARL